MDRAAPDSVAILSARISRFDIVEPLDDRALANRHVQYTIHVKRHVHAYDIRKRFSEFVELHASLATASGLKVNFCLPSKTLFRCFDEEYLEERMNALNVYLSEICGRRDLSVHSTVLKFFEPQLQPDWVSSGEPPKPGFFGTIRDISKGGKRSKDTFTTVMDLINEHKKFKKEIAEMIERKAPDDEIQTRTSSYLMTSAERVRDMMLRHGGFQVKLGQAISAQKNMLPREITQTLSACCDKAYSQPLSAIQAQVTAVLGRPLDEVFSYISEEPLAAASIAQVHRARLRSSGEEVIVKVVHPGVNDNMRADAAFMPYLIKLIERVEPGHGLHPLHVTMDSMLQQELDMRREGQNRERLAAVIARSERSERSEHADVLCPRVYWELCRDGLMVQEFASGAVALGDKDEVNALGVPYQLAVAELAELFGETAFIHGYLHNDLHPGNVLVRRSSASGPQPSPQLRQFALVGLLSAAYLAMALLAVLLLCCLAKLASLRAWLSASFCSLAILLSSVVLAGARSERAEKERLQQWVRGLPEMLLMLAASGFGLHMRLRGKAERLVSRATRDRFELIIIDHGFHTYLPFEFRMTWCKVWAAVGLVNEPLLQEAAAELNLEGDEYKVLPLILGLLPYPYWKRHQFPSPAELIELMKDEDIGLPRCKSMDKKMPHLWHLVMRVNGQVSALFQMQYGLSPTCRYEFMRLMTRSALMGLRFTERPIGELPVPGCLTTADREFFEASLPLVEEQMRAEFRWNQKFKGDQWNPNGKFLNNLKKEIAEEAAGSNPAAPAAPNS